MHASRPPQRIGWRSFVFLAIAAGVWGGAVHLRPYTLSTHCVSEPARCTASEVFAPDRIALGQDDRDADSRSFDTQRWASALALIGPWAWMMSLVLLTGFPVLAAIRLSAIDVVLVLQSYVANGALNEFVKTFAERPRPFVYADPGRFGLDPAHYTSFYSGHTSFAAASAIALVLALRRRGAPPPVVAIAGVLGMGLACATGYFRVASGRHFPTDVIAGLIFGAATAIAVAQVHRGKLASPVTAQA